ncbi:MAG: ATP-dependent nuclease, partial [Pseudonocardiaceae bacterium]
MRNYRSFFAGTEDITLDLELRDGMNTLVGPNNCGKSNLLRAVALAMDPNYPFDRASDIPAQMEWAFPRVTLHFSCDGRISTEQTLLRYAADYERSAVGGRTGGYASEGGELRFVVTYIGDRQSGGKRQEFFLARGAGNRQVDVEKRDKLIRQFRKACRFVLVESGESLQSLLTGRFREILHMVIRDHLGTQIAAAERRRSDYIEGLQGDLLKPLRERIDAVVQQLFPEISGVRLIPKVPDIDETLSNIDVALTDSAETALASKGTGVRGAVMVAMLRYLAEQTRRSMIFAIEEPESFLHPAAQEALRDDLEGLAERQDVTLLVTTHS